jgi:hypothetical protein
MRAKEIAGSPEIRSIPRMQDRISRWNVDKKGGDVMTEREEFEKWLIAHHGLQSDWSIERNCFVDYQAHLAFKAFQAGRRSRQKQDAEICRENNPIPWSDPKNVKKMNRTVGAYSCATKIEDTE